MFSTARSILALASALVVLAPSASAFDSPLSDTAVRSAYFLGQRYKADPGDFLGPYTKFLPTPKTGPHIELVQFLTPFAQLVRAFSTRVADSSAQQAQLDHRGKEETVQVIVKILLTDTYPPVVLPDPYTTAKLPPNDCLRKSTFWKDFEFRVFDDQSKRAPANISGKGDFNCDDGGNCTLIGATVTLEFSPSAFSSTLATIEVTGPNGQIVHADFDLAPFR